MSAKKKVRPSNEPQHVTPHLWYYEYAGRIDLCVEEPGTGKVLQARIPWRRLMESAKRCGRRLP